MYQVHTLYGYILSLSHLNQGNKMDRCSVMHPNMYKNFGLYYIVGRNTHTHLFTYIFAYRIAPQDRPPTSTYCTYVPVPTERFAITTTFVEQSQANLAYLYNSSTGGASMFVPFFLYLLSPPLNNLECTQQQLHFLRPSPQRAFVSKRFTHGIAVLYYHIHAGEPHTCGFTSSLPLQLDCNKSRVPSQVAGGTGLREIARVCIYVLTQPCQAQYCTAALRVDFDDSIQS